MKIFILKLNCKEKKKARHFSYTIEYPYPPTKSLLSENKTKPRPSRRKKEPQIIFRILACIFIKLSTTNYCTHKINIYSITPHLPLKEEPQIKILVALCVCVSADGSLGEGGRFILECVCLTVEVFSFVYKLYILYRAVH